MLSKIAPSNVGRVALTHRNHTFESATKVLLSAPRDVLNNPQVVWRHRLDEDSSPRRKPATCENSNQQRRNRTPIRGSRQDTGRFACLPTKYCCLPNFGRCGRSQDRVRVNCPLADPFYPAEWMAETHFFAQLITLLDIDSIGQNWEDRKKHDKCTNVIGQRWSLGRSIEPIEGRTGSSFCRSQGTVQRRRRRRWRPVAPRTRRPRRADEGGPSLPHWPPGNTNGTSRDQTAPRPVCPTSHAPSGGRRRNSGRRALPSPR